MWTVVSKGAVPLPLAFAPRRLRVAGWSLKAYSGLARLYVRRWAPPGLRCGVVDAGSGRLGVLCDWVPGGGVQVHVPVDALLLLSRKPGAAPPGVSVHAGYGNVLVVRGSAKVAMTVSDAGVGVEFGWTPGGFYPLLSAPPLWQPRRRIHVWVEAGRVGDLVALLRRLSTLPPQRVASDGLVWAVAGASTPVPGRRRLLVPRSGRGSLSYTVLQEALYPSTAAWEAVLTAKPSWPGCTPVEVWARVDPATGLVDVGVAPRGAPLPPPAPLHLVEELAATLDPVEAARRAAARAAAGGTGVEAEFMGLSVVAERAAEEEALPALKFSDAAPPAPVRLLVPATASLTVEWEAGCDEAAAALAEAARLYWRMVGRGGAEWRPEGEPSS